MKSKIDFLPQVINMFVEGIPWDSRDGCVLSNGKKLEPDANLQEKHEFLCDFVKEKLTEISFVEYANWLNGQMPFVTFREIQIWRFRQFAEKIWKWNIPEPENIAMIFNLTRTRAVNLISDFRARFCKLFIMPKSLRRIFNIISTKKTSIESKIKEKTGYYYTVPSPSYLNDLNSIIHDLKSLLNVEYFQSSVLYKTNPKLMWIDDEVAEALNKNTSECVDALMAMYPED
jgi:hypothetical protein